MQSAAKTYFQTQFTTMGQGELLILLYDGALKFLAQAKEKIAEKDYGAKGIAISKALDIIAELDGTLNPEAGGELVENLHQLYFICSMRLLKANLKLDVELIDSVMGVLSGLRSAYSDIMNNPDALAAGQQIAAKQKSFNIKGQANMQSAAPTQPLAGGARAQMAYATAARQVALSPQPGQPSAVMPGMPQTASPMPPSAPVQPIAPGSLVTAQPQLSEPASPAPGRPVPPVGGIAPVTPAQPGLADSGIRAPLTPNPYANRSVAAAYGRAEQVRP